MHVAFFTAQRLWRASALFHDNCRPVGFHSIRILYEQTSATARAIVIEATTWISCTKDTRKCVGCSTYKPHLLTILSSSMQLGVLRTICWRSNVAPLVERPHHCSITAHPITIPEVSEVQILSVPTCDVDSVCSDLLAHQLLESFRALHLLVFDVLWARGTPAPAREKLTTADKLFGQLVTLRHVARISCILEAAIPVAQQVGLRLACEKRSRPSTANVCTSLAAFGLISWHS
mmetsp:Transcript_21180/g.39759  ORF Transcript_21180/g.39759 Transcript_21180/m.39759 type:complete len:233 (+) Transcript_21180:793-1491(+)